MNINDTIDKLIINSHSDNLKRIDFGANINFMSIIIN